MLKSLVRFILRGFTSALTGGLHYDRNHSLLLNTVHLYLWLFFLLFPIILTFAIGKHNLGVQIGYPATILLLFTALKLPNYYFHHFFNVNERGVVASLKNWKRERKDKKDETTEEVNNNAETITTPATVTQVEQIELPTIIDGPVESLLDETTATTATDTVIPQLDGPSDEDNNISAVDDEDIPRTYTLHFTDEYGNKIPYEIQMTKREYEREYGSEVADPVEPESVPTTPTRNVPSLTFSQNRRSSLRIDARSPSVTTPNTATPLTTPNSPLNPIRQSGTYTINTKDTSESDQYYKISILGSVVNIPFDRQDLESFMDRNHYLLETIWSIIFATFVAWVAYRLTELYSKFFAIIFMWVITASCHFSLVKSPQPDAHAPVHFTMWTAYSRSFYFTILAGIAFLANFLANHKNVASYPLYGFPFDFFMVMVTIRDLALYSILCFPLIFLMGWAPHCGTFASVLLEQVNIHCFGGSGGVSLIGIFIQFILDACATGILIGIGYYSSMKQTFGKDYYSGIFGAVAIALSYLLSRAPSNPNYYWAPFVNIYELAKNVHCLITKKQSTVSKEVVSKQKVRDFERNLMGVNPLFRIGLDFAVAFGLGLFCIPILVFDAFNRGPNPYITYVISAIIPIMGFITYYLIPQLSKHHPWLILRQPLLVPYIPEWWKKNEKLKKIDWAWFEILSYVLRWIEIALYIILVLANIGPAARNASSKYHPGLAIFFTSVATIRLMRGAFADPSRMWMALGLQVLIFNIDIRHRSETLIFDMFFLCYIILKIDELLEKLQFVLIYATPRISWGSVYHVVLQPAAIPHLVVIIWEIIMSVILTAPLYPITGSTNFFMSYPRALKFWEKNYKTKRKDASNTKLSQSLGSGSSSQYDSNNLNSIFYEHLVVAMQRAIPNALRRGQLGNITAGDIIIIMNDALTAMVHFSELSNGVCSFQLRGLEFKGTLCQEREQEAIIHTVEREEPPALREFTETIVERFPSLEKILQRFQFLKPSIALNMRWHTWEILRTDFNLTTYNVMENNAETIMSGFDQRKQIITLYIRAIQYYLLQRDELDLWVSADSPFSAAFTDVVPDIKVDCDPLFSPRFDEDYDYTKNGISYTAFEGKYNGFIDHFIQQRQTERNVTYSATQVADIKKLSFLCSLVARRVLAAPDGNNVAVHPKQFLERLHQLFKGDYRITSSKDEWIFGDMEILAKVLVPGVRASLKLYNDQFIAADVESPDSLYQLLHDEYKNLFIGHEGDPEWRQQLLQEAPQMFSLRKKIEDEQKEGPQYFILQLEHQTMNFSTIRLNRESVRGLWAGQVHELVFLGNETMERGSIQQMKYVLRNIINSTADVPIGYPVFISPLTTAYW